MGEIEGFPGHLRSPRQSWEDGSALPALATLGQLGLGGGNSPLGAEIALGRESSGAPVLQALLP